MFFSTYVEKKERKKNPKKKFLSYFIRKDFIKKKCFIHISSNTVLNEFHSSW